MNSDLLPDIFQYLDYRKYLADFYRIKKSVNRTYSHRVFSMKAGFKSTGYFSDVVNGKRNLSKSYVALFAKALDLGDREKNYFELMVSFGHAKSESAKQAVYDMMVKTLPLKIQKIRQSQKDYFTKWYHVAVRETLSIRKIKDDYETLAASLDPPITAAQAKAAVKLLAGMDLIEKDAEGCWRARHVSLLSKGDESLAMLVRTFQGEMMEKAREALVRVPQHRRDISSVTLSVSRTGMMRIRNIVEDFHKRVLEVVQTDKHEDRVLQVNLQVFPLSRVEDEPEAVSAEDLEEGSHAARR